MLIDSGSTHSLVVSCFGLSCLMPTYLTSPKQIGVDLVAFAVDSNPDVDPTQLTGDSRSTKSLKGRQTCLDEWHTFFR